MKYFEKVEADKVIENMSKSTEKETPTAPPPSEVTSPSAAPVTSAPPAALKGYYTCPPQNQQPKGYPVQQIPLHGIPAIQNQPYPAAYPQQYPQQYHPTQPGQIAIYPTSQSTPLIVDASGVVDYLKDQMTSSDNVLLYQQMKQNQQQAQQQGRRNNNEAKSDCDDCCKCFNSCDAACSDLLYCLFCCWIFDCLCCLCK